MKLSTWGWKTQAGRARIKFKDDLIQGFYIFPMRGVCLSVTGSHGAVGSNIGQIMAIDMRRLRIRIIIRDQAPCLHYSCLMVLSVQLILSGFVIEPSHH